jgi:uncharacterized protein
VTVAKPITHALRIPAALAAIRDEAIAFQAHSDERIRTLHQWAQQTERLSQVTHRVLVEDDDDTIRIGELSPGCRACKDGKWDCLFLSLACNLSCAFCLTPCGLTKATAVSAFGNNMEALCENYSNLGTIGIGFSGGEPLLSPQHLLYCLSRLRERRSDLYIWVYTNGMLLTKDLISALVGAGLDELRFNMAATGYSHGHVTAMLRHAVARLPSVAVEIPAIPEHAGPMRKALPVWSRAGVKYLNFHDLIYEPGSPSETMAGAREHCRMPDGHVCDFNPHSVDLVSDVMRDIDLGALPISINFCSLRNKARQLRGRRSMMAAYTLQSYENLCGEGEAESACYFNDTHYEFVHPATAAGSKLRPSRFGAALVRRLLPLTPEGIGQWTHFEIIHEAEGS